MIKGDINKESVLWQRFEKLADRIYGWGLDFSYEQFRLWLAGVRDIRISDATLCLMEMAEGKENIESLVWQNRI